MNPIDILSVLALSAGLALYLVWSAKTEMGTKPFNSSKRDD
jgi:hypothetical protein